MFINILPNIIFLANTNTMGTNFLCQSKVDYGCNMSITCVSQTKLHLQHPNYAKNLLNLNLIILRNYQYVLNILKWQVHINKWI